MTLPAGTTIGGPYEADGLSVEFQVPFRFFTDSELLVVVYIEDVRYVKTLASDYTVTGAGEDAGGVVTFVEAPPDESIVLIRRNTALAQEYSYQTAGNFPAVSHELLMDRMVGIIQELDERLSRCLILPELSEGVDTEFPDPTEADGLLRSIGGTLVFSDDESIVDPGDLVTEGMTVAGYVKNTAAGVLQGGQTVPEADPPDPASDTVAGIVELATPAEALTGTDQERAVTPEGLKGVADTKMNVDDPHVVQIVSTFTGEKTTGSTVIPWDDTIPQKTEGDQYMSLAITPLAAGHKLKITVHALAASTTGQEIVMALFQDDVANALAVTAYMPHQINYICPLSLTCLVDTVGTDLTTFKVRIGSINAATVTFNGVNNTRYFGGTFNSFILIEEIIP